MKSNLTEKQVDLEIERLKASPLVMLARREQKLKYEAKKNAKRDYLYTLRHLERRGQQLKESGVTMEQLNELARQQRREYDPFDDRDDGDEWF